MESVIGCLALALGSPLGRGGRPLVILVEEPILLWVVQRVDHFGHEFELLRDLKHCTGVLVTAAVVCRREDSEELSTGESFETIHDALVCSQDELASVCIKEVLDTIRAEFDDVSRAIGVSDEVRLDAQILIAISGVRPEDVDD